MSRPREATGRQDRGRIVKCHHHLALVEGRDRGGRRVDGRAPVTDTRREVFLGETYSLRAAERYGEKKELLPIAMLGATLERTRTNQINLGIRPSKTKSSARSLRTCKPVVLTAVSPFRTLQQPPEWIRGPRD